MMSAPDPGDSAALASATSRWTTSHASTQRAKELGATMIMENIPVADFGKFTIFKDPTGAAIAMSAASTGKKYRRREQRRRMRALRAL